MIRICLLVVVGTVGAHVSADEVPVRSVVLGLVNDVEIACEEAGRVTDAPIDVGWRVEKGDLLIALDRSDPELRYHTAQAELEIARAEADDDLDVQIAEKALAVAQAELKRAEEAKAKYNDSVSDTELDALRYTRDQAALQIQRAKKSIELARLRVRLKEAESELAKYQIERRSLKSPLNGLIVKKEAEAGEWIQPGQVVFRIIQTDRLRAEGFIDGQFSGIKMGMPVRVELPGETGETTVVEGTITFVDPEISPITRQYRIWAEIGNSDGRLRPGQTPLMTVIRPDQNVSVD